ncbi:Ig kappa chain V-IV region B17-like [Scleropages formosus]|uniref:Ig kappa chain V-IV region B17-like n=1 Tax=Scleropages formosus TaxID=113540 RepID=A0A0P7UBU4_SCLFO|nr:Ig kappa chain V-IV region B17-like [Scleropages formosus]
MTLITIFICSVAYFTQWAAGEILMTQTPETLSVQLGQTVSISCTASSSISSYLAWYLQKPGEVPKLLIHSSNTRQPGVPDRFTGSGSGTQYTLKIGGVQIEDAGMYYCQEGYSSYTRQ